MFVSALIAPSKLLTPFAVLQIKLLVPLKCIVLADAQIAPAQ